jgi:Cation transport protein
MDQNLNFRERLGAIYYKIPHPVRRFLRILKYQLPELNFITLHYIYFIGTCLLTAVIFWGSSTPRIGFTDCIFFTVSAMTEAGLNTINLSQLNTFQQFILFLLIMLGSAIWVSLFVVYVRRKAFENRFEQVIQKENRLGQRIWRTITKSRTRDDKDRDRQILAQTTGASFHQPDYQSPPHSTHSADGADLDVPPERNELIAYSNPENETQNVQVADAPAIPASPTSPQRRDHISFTSDTHFKSNRQNNEEQPIRHRLLSFSGVGARPDYVRNTLSLNARRSHSIDSSRPHVNDNESQPEGIRGRFIPNERFLGRNSAFHGLSFEDRERLGGTEYKAVVFLSWVVPIYFVLWQFLGSISLGAYIATYHADTTRTNGLNPWWVGAFNAVSAFNNSGMSLLDANMTVFNEDAFILLSMSAFILAGNTCYPVFLRLFIWISLKILPDNEKWSDRRYTLQFLLEHPRRCYTNLFPSQHTWWLFWSVIVLNGIDTIMYALLNVGLPLL